MPYVDGFVIPVPKRNVETYRRIARKAGKVWMEYGALEYRECVGDDLKIKGLTLFPRAARAKPNKPWCFHGSCISRKRIATASTPR